jgi:hypothetical protein
MEPPRLINTALGHLKMQVRMKIDPVPDVWSRLVKSSDRRFSSAGRRRPCGACLSGGTSFVDRQVTALQILAVQRGDGPIGLVLDRHFNDTEAPVNLSSMTFQLWTSPKA